MEPDMIVGKVVSTGFANTPDEALYFALQKEAEKLYAHAVIVQQNSLQNFTENGLSKKRITAIAIRYIQNRTAQEDVPQEEQLPPLSNPVATPYGNFPPQGMPQGYPQQEMPTQKQTPNRQKKH